MKEAVAGRGLATSFLAEDKRFMAQVIAPGSFGPLTIVVASFLGAAQSEVVRFWIHPGLIALAMVVNAWAFLRQRRVIAAKRRHLEEARQALREIDGAPVPATEVGSGPPAQFAIGAIVLLSGLSAAGYYLYRRFIMGDLRAPSAASLIAGVALAVLGAVLMQRGRASS